MRHHVSQGIELRKRKSKILTKRTRVSPILFTLRLVTALYFAMALSLSCCLFLPAQAEETSTRDNWKIAKANVDKFLAMNGEAIADLFGSKTTNELPCKIDINDQIVLQFYNRKSLPIREFYISLTEPTQHQYLSFNHRAKGGFELRESPNTIWTGAKRKSEKEYWKIIKANLDKFIGMSGDEIIALLGPERCSSKPRNFIQYRIGDAGLTFFLKAGKVHKFKFKSDAYIPGT
jgi:hypothetical protein